MNLNKNIVKSYINYFYRRIVGFNTERIDYMDFSVVSKNVYFSVAMDRVKRLEDVSGRLRDNIWNNIVFVFHEGEIDPKEDHEVFFDKLRKETPSIFIRSYVYVVYINVAKTKIVNMFDADDYDISTKDFKIYYFNTNYEISETTSRTNIFVRVKEGFVLEDYMYIPNTKHEYERMIAANSDVLDVIRAFNNELTLVDQTKRMISEVNGSLKEPDASIIIKGPARSGKTIIAASLLNEHPESKLLIMNFYFYKAIVDGMKALSKFSKEEVEEITGSKKLVSLYEIKYLLNRVLKNLEYIQKLNSNSVTDNNIRYLGENVNKLVELFETNDIVYKENKLLNELVDFNYNIKTTKIKDDSKIEQLMTKIENELLVSGDDIGEMKSDFDKLIENLIVNSKQRIYHHDTKKANHDGCWVTRGLPSKSNMWTEHSKVPLVIVDEFQRLGTIHEYYVRDRYTGEYRQIYDEFREHHELVNNADQVVYVGDSNQMLNNIYDEGLPVILTELKAANKPIVEHKLPDSVGIETPLTELMQYLTIGNVDFDNLVNLWSVEVRHDITIINNNSSKLVEKLNSDPATTKHFATPVDHLWESYQEFETIMNNDVQITKLEKDFADTYPFFCNEEVMSSYMLAAYQLISRELESLYVYIPKMDYLQIEKDIQEQRKFRRYEINTFDQFISWYKKHKYVLFTRPTKRLVINIADEKEYLNYKDKIHKLANSGAKLKVKFLD